MTHLGAGIDKFQLGMDKEGLSQSQNTFLRSNTTSLDHNKVLFDQTVMRESSHRIDGFICQIIIGGGIIFHKLAIPHVESITDVVDLLIDLGTMMVAFLTSSCHSILDSARMPSTNTSNLAKTFMSLPWELLCVPS